MDSRDWAVIASAAAAAGSLALSYSELSRTSRSEKRCERIQKIANEAPPATKPHLQLVAEKAAADVVVRHWLKTQPLFYPMNVGIVLLFSGFIIIQTLRYRAHAIDAGILWSGIGLCALLGGQSAVRLLRHEYKLRTVILLVEQGVQDVDDVWPLSYQERGYEAAAIRTTPKRVKRHLDRVAKSKAMRDRIAVEEAQREVKRARRWASRHAENHQPDEDRLL